MNPRLLILAIAICAVAGVPIGMYVSSRSVSTHVPLLPPPVEPITHRFSLLPADLQASQEHPAIAIDGQGRLVLAWASETEDKVRTVFLTRSTDGGKTLTVPEAFRKVPILRFVSKGRGGKEIVRVTSALPRLAASGNVIALAWTEHLGEGKVEFRVAKSTDGGVTFSSPMTAHGPEGVRPTFTSLAVGSDGRIACSWLDHRAGVQQPYCAILPPNATTFRPETLVFAGPDNQGICPCCDTDTFCADDGTTLVAFRNNVGNIRECHVCRLAPGAMEFSKPEPMSSHNWPFNGCPHDGPSLAVAKGNLHVGWMDAHTGPMRVFLTRTAAGTTGYSEAVPVSTTGTQEHPQLIVGSDGSTIHAVWDAGTGSEPLTAHAGHAVAATGTRAVMYARFQESDMAAPASRPLAAMDGVSQSHPNIAVGPDGVPVVVWSELTEAGKAVVMFRATGSE